MINVGIAGLGKMGKLHFKNSSKNNKINLVAVADLKKSNLKIVNKKSINKYVDYKKMIESENLDAVIISLPNFLKKESIEFASENNISIFIDKPLARNLKEVEQIKNKVEKNKTQITVGVNYRYYKSCQRIKKIVNEGEIGEVVLATSELIMDGPLSHPLIPAPVPEWWFDKERSGGGVIMDLGYHLIDLLTWLFGKQTLEYSSIGHRYNLPIEDTASILLKSESGTTSNVNIGWFSKMIFPNFNFRINLHGTVGYTSTDKFAPRNLYTHAAKEGIKNFFKRLTARRIEYLSYTYYYSSFYEILDKFYDSVIDASDPPVDFDQQISVMKTIESIYENSG